METMTSSSDDMEQPGEPSLDLDDHIKTVLQYRRELREDNNLFQREEEQWNDLVVALETLVEQGPDVYQKELGKEALLLQDLSQARRQLVMFDTECEERLLDWAIASKRAGKMDECVVAHKKRMDLVPRYKTTDAVRLLGLSDNGRTIEELPPAKGLFERDSCTDTIDKFQPSSSAIDIGNQIRCIFEEHRYTLANCTIILISTVQESVSDGRMFSANSFFHHRHDLDMHPATSMSSLDVLVRLFLFGLALPLEMVRHTIGNNSVETLFEAGLICTSQADNCDVVGEVQIYPISPADLFLDSSENSDWNCWFMTDWPMESLRLTRDAVMPVGYDTLELMSLSAALKPSEYSCLLDLCCGSGIQGIFAVLCNSDRFSELVCSDVNERACRFAAANMALNTRDPDIVCHAVKGDLYENVQGTFDYILSNPPFVAIPSHGISNQILPALYAVGGGADGMALLRRVVNESPKYLNGTSAVLLVVSELPNIESSCRLISSFLPKNTRAFIRIAYVGADVESVEQYAATREQEAPNDIERRDWASELFYIGCTNRALALMSLSSIGNGSEMALYQYGDRVVDGTEDNCSSNALDEEDAFLTREGIQFTRNHLL